MSNEVVVSAYCLAYNHEKYIKSASEGFVSQKTDFKYEVFVHDDASTDKTADIINQYAKRYPNIIKPILQKENQYSKGVDISQEIIFPRMKGKYVAICEGDDYWCDNNKLQKQVNSLQVTSRGSMTSRSSNSLSEKSKETQTTVATGTKGEHQSYAHDLCINTYGWSEYDFTCLVKLWNRESGWSPNAHNKSSGAHGIAQALPASKMASEGSDYYTNGKTQIRWGLKYIKNRYGSPASAWAHSQQTGWY